MSDDPSQTGRFWICPQCHRHASVRLTTCRCGYKRTAAEVVSPGAQAGSPRPPARPAAVPARSTSASRGVLVRRVLVGLLVVGALAGLGWVGYGTLRARLLAELRGEMTNQSPRADGGPASNPAAEAAPGAGGPSAGAATGTTTPVPLGRDWSQVNQKGTFAALSSADQDLALGIARRLSEKGEVAQDDVINVETLHRHYPAEGVVRELVTSVLLRSADQKRSRGDFAQARTLLDRAATLFPDDRTLRRAQLVLLVEMREWPAVEGAARVALSADPADPEARRALALALAARGDDREALRALYAALEVVSNTVDEPQLRSLRDQIERRLWTTSGCENSQLPDAARTGEAGQRLEKFLALLSSCSGGSVGQQLSHFSVGYRRTGQPPDSDRWVQVVPIETVGRDVLRLLEKQYSTLATALDYQMQRGVPVVIMEGAEYRVSTGAPVWAGGQFDSDDGTITIPVNIFQRIVFQDPEIERRWNEIKEQWIEKALLHETAHAFIEEMTQGAAPRPFNEGLAQFLEREVTHEREDLVVTLAQGVRKRAEEAYPTDAVAKEAALQENCASCHDSRQGRQWVFRDKEEARRHFSNVLLSKAVEEFRTEGLGQAPTVFTTYQGGELFVEYLVKQRGMGGIQAVLKAMASTKSVDAAFEEVYGRGYDGTRRAWLDWLRGQWGASAPRR